VNLDVIFNAYNTAIHHAWRHGRDLEQLCIPWCSAAWRYRQTYRSAHSSDTDLYANTGN